MANEFQLACDDVLTEGTGSPKGIEDTGAAVAVLWLWLALAVGPDGACAAVYLAT